MTNDPIGETPPEKTIKYQTTSGEPLQDEDAGIDGPHYRLMRIGTYAAVAVAAVLIGVKGFAWVVTGSVAMLATLLDSLLDLLASGINLFAVRHALTPADKEHRFGHGKAEPLAGLAQSAFVAGSALFLLLEAGDRLLNPQPVKQSATGIAVMVFAIVLTLALVLFQRHVIKRTGSVAISADSLHYKTDLYVNISVIVSFLLISEFGWIIADPLFGIGIGLYILWGAWRILRQSLDLLMDRELPEEDREKIKKIVLAHPKVLRVHDLRTRSNGPQTFIQMHIEMSGKLNLWEAHDISDTVMFKVEEAFPNAEVLIHQDPAGVEERRAVFE